MSVVITGELTKKAKELRKKANEFNLIDNFALRLLFKNTKIL